MDYLSVLKYKNNLLEKIVSVHIGFNYHMNTYMHKGKGITWNKCMQFKS